MYFLKDKKYLSNYPNRIIDSDKNFTFGRKIWTLICIMQK